MKELLSRLQEIGDKAEYLDRKSSILIDQNRALRARITELESQLSSRESELKELGDQYQIVKFARNMDGVADNEKSEELKKKINEYIREIDQCLKLIGD